MYCRAAIVSAELMGVISLRQVSNFPKACLQSSQLSSVRQVFMLEPGVNSVFCDQETLYFPKVILSRQTVPSSGNKSFKPQTARVISRERNGTGGEKEAQ